MCNVRIEEFVLVMTDVVVNRDFQVQHAKSVSELHYIHVVSTQMSL